MQYALKTQCTYNKKSDIYLSLTTILHMQYDLTQKNSYIAYYTQQRHFNTQNIITSVKYDAV